LSAEAEGEGGSSPVFSPSPASPLRRDTRVLAMAAVILSQE
jgi:hypothetical protein